jgi:hypothetical protein
VLLSSQRGVVAGSQMKDTDICGLVLKQFGA